MNGFTKRGKEMDLKWEEIFYATVEQKMARFIELHVNSKNNRITFTPERFKELTDYVGRTKTPIKNHNLKSLREANLIKFVWVNGSGHREYMLNPAWSNQFSDADLEKYIELYDKLTDGNLEYNNKVRYGNVDTEENSGNTEENDDEEESNKSNNEGEDPKGEQREISPEESTLEKLKSLSYDIDHKNNPNMLLIRKAKIKFYEKTKKDLGNIECAVIRGKVVGRCNGQVDVEGSLYDEKENKSYIRISE